MDTWRVRIQDISGHTHGAGVLLNRFQVLTCARVVAAALRADNAGQLPLGELRIDFVHRPMTRGRWRAWVGPGGWVPARQDGSGDLAVLEFAGEPPDDISPPRLRACDEPRNRTVRIFGHPPRSPGTEVSARMMGTEGSGPQAWVRLSSQGLAQYRHGFRGAGVVDDETGEVIGCLIDAAPAGAIWGRMMPMEVAAGLLSGLHSLLPGLAGQRPPLAGPDQAAFTQTAAGAAHQLSSQERAMLKAELIRLFSSAWQTPDLLADALEGKFGRSLSVTRYRSPVAYFNGLVDACLEQPGAMRELFALLSSVDRPGSAVPGGGISPREIEEMDRRIKALDPEPLLTIRQRHDLYDLLADVDFSVAVDAYYEAVGPAGRPLPPYASDPITMARELEATNLSADGLPPVVSFAEAVATRLPAFGERAESIRQWTDDYVAPHPDLEGPVLERRLGYGDGRPNAKARLALLLWLQPDPLDPDRYRTTARLQRASAPSSGLYQDNVGHDRAELSALLDELLIHVRQPSAGPAPHPIVEFILPRWMLGLDVVVWQVGGVLPRRLGESLPVVVRSLDRAIDTALHLPWQAKWAWLMSNGDRPQPSAVHALWTAGTPPTVLAGLLSGNPSASSAPSIPPVCLLLGFPAAEADSLDMDDEVSVALRAGMPIIVWCRDPHAGTDFSDLEQLLRTAPLTELPESVWHLRLAASGQPPGQLAQRLILLYDDASRIPEPDGLVRAPS
jgi:hypothetical protein